MLMHVVYFAFAYCEIARLLLASARRRVASPLMAGQHLDSAMTRGRLRRHKAGLLRRSGGRRIRNQRLATRCGLDPQNSGMPS